VLLVCLVNQGPPDLPVPQETAASLGRRVRGDSQASKGRQELWELKDPKVRWETEETEGPRFEGLKAFQDLPDFLVSPGSLGTERMVWMGREDHLVSLGRLVSLVLLARLGPWATATPQLATSVLGSWTPV